MLKGVKKVTAGQNDLNSHPNLGTPGKNGGGGEAERSKEGHSRPKWMEEERLQKNEKGYRIEALEILAIWISQQLKFRSKESNTSPRGYRMLILRSHSIRSR